MAYIADAVLVLREIATPAAATGKYIDVVEMPPGKGVWDAVADDGSYAKVTECILRTSVSECQGKPYFINFLDGGFSDISITLTAGCPPDGHADKSEVLNFSWTVTTAFNITAAEVLENGVKIGDASTAGGGIYTYAYNTGATSKQSVTISLKITTDAPSTRTAGVCTFMVSDVPTIAWSDPTSDLTIDAFIGYTFKWTVVVDPATGADNKDAQSVEMFFDGAKLGNASWDITNGWHLYRPLEIAGAGPIKGRVTDKWGLTAETAELTLTVTNPSAPTIVWVQPATDITIDKLTSTTMIWSATPDTGRSIDRVDVYQNLALYGQATENAGNWELTWLAPDVADDTTVDYLWSAVAVDDLNNASLASPNRTITVEGTMTAPAVGYALRWYGAGVADQTYTDNRTLMYQSEGMLDGTITDRQTDRAIVIANERLGNDGLGLGQSRLRSDTEEAFVLGKTFIHKAIDGNNIASKYWMTFRGTTTNYYYQLRGNGDISWVNSGAAIKTLRLYTVVEGTPSDLMAVCGGHNGSAEPDPTTGDRGLSFFSNDGSGWKLMYVAPDTYYIGEGMRWGMNSNADGEVSSVDAAIIPDIPLPQLLTPLAMDTFTGSDGDPIDVAWTEYNNPTNEIQGNAIRMHGQGTGTGDRNFIMRDVGITDVVLRYWFVNGTATYGHGAVARFVDVNNCVRIFVGASTLDIRETVTGSDLVRNSVAFTPASGQSYVMIVDGDTAIVVGDDATLLNWSPISNLTGTEVGLCSFRPAAATSDIDNWSCYPRRSTTQYDDVIQPYIDNLGVVAGSNPAAPPKYLSYFNFEGVADQTFTGDNEYTDDPSVGIIIGEWMFRNGQIINEAYEGGIGTGYTANTTTGLGAGQGAVAMVGFKGTTGTQANALGGFGWALTGSFANENNSNEWPTRTDKMAVNRMTASRLDLGANFVIGADSTHAAFVGGFNTDGEPYPGSGNTYTEGSWTFAKPNGGQWRIIYGHGSGKNDPIAMGGTSGHGCTYKWGAWPNADLSSVVTPAVLDTFTDVDATRLLDHTSDLGMTYSYISGTSTYLQILSNKLEATGGNCVYSMDGVAMSDFVARYMAATGTGTSQTHQLQFRVVDDNNKNVAVRRGDNIEIGQTITGSYTPLTSIAITVTGGQEYPLVVIADNDAITMIHNDTDVVSIASITVLAGTEMRVWSITAGNTWDNFQVLPIRSYSQYDEVLDPYVPGSAPLIFHDSYLTGPFGTPPDSWNIREPDTVGTGLWTTSGDTFPQIHDPADTGTYDENGGLECRFNNYNFLWEGSNNTLTDFIITAEYMTRDTSDLDSDLWPRMLYRYTDDNNYYWLSVSGGALRLYIEDAGSQSYETVGSVATLLHYAHIRIEVRGSNHKFYRNDVLVGEVTNAVHSSGKFGFVPLIKSAHRMRNLKIYDLS